MTTILQKKTKTKFSKYNIYRHAVFPAFVLALLAPLTSIAAPAPVRAETLPFSINVKPSLNITIPGDTVSLQLNPSNVAFNSEDFEIVVGTNNEAGYTLSVTANSTDLTRTESMPDGSTPTIPTLENEVADATNFPANYWGYKKTLVNDAGTTTLSTNYLPFVTSLELNSSDTKVNADKTTLTFGAKTDYLKPAGTYNLTLSFVATATPSVQYMQDLDGRVCTTTPIAVVDARDEQVYTIQRLADGKCWMTQSLNLAGGTTITPADSDVAANYTLPASATKNAGDNNLTDSTQFSDNTKQYVFNSGNTSDCGGSGQNVPCGSYYSWLTATAGSGSSITGNGNNAAYSICPKGWRLPTSTTSDASAQSNNNWKTGDWYALATAYGANLDSNYYDNSSTTGANFYNNAGPGTSTGFLLAGYYYSGSFDSGGSYGYYWSSTSGSSTYAYNLYFNSGYVNSAGGSNRRYGRSVRCLLAE